MTRSKEDVKEKLLDLYISNVNVYLSKVDSIKAVVRKYDGKVINIKFKNELEDVYNSDIEDAKRFYFHVEINSKRFKIDIDFRNNDFISEDYYSNWFDAWSTNSYYLNRSMSTLTVSHIYHVYDFYTLSDGGNCRLVADAVIKDIDGKADTLRQTLKTIEDGRKRLDEWQKAREELNRQIDTLNEILPKEVRYVYGIDEVLHV